MAVLVQDTAQEIRKTRVRARSKECGCSIAKYTERVLVLGVCVYDARLGWHCATIQVW